jgi:hypothetical protein
LLLFVPNNLRRGSQKKRKMGSMKSAYERFVLAKRIEVSGVVRGSQCDTCRSFDRACVMSYLSLRCSTCEIFDRECSSHTDAGWDSFLARLRELQAQESFARLELSTLVTQMNKCLNRISEIVREKSYLLRGRPDTLLGPRADVTVRT